MLKQLNKVIKISFLILILGFSKAYSIDDDLGAFTDAIDVVREEFNNISEASTEQSKIIDEAMQMHGGLGISSDTPLASWYGAQRTLRFADGPDSVHRMVIGRRELREYNK